MPQDVEGKAIAAEKLESSLFVCLKAGKEEKGHYKIPHKAMERQEENVKCEQSVWQPAGHPALPSLSPAQPFPSPSVREPKDVRSAAAPTPPALYKHFHISECFPQRVLHPGALAQYHFHPSTESGPDSQIQHLLHLLWS